MPLRYTRSASPAELSRLTEGEGGEEVVAVAIGGKRARFTHQRPDDMLVVDAVLPPTRQTWHGADQRRAELGFDGLGAQTHGERRPYEA